MKNDPWWQKAMIYELYVDLFAGNFKLLAEKINHFSFLGINALHVLPYFPSPMVDDGYDVSDYLSIRKELGSLKDFRNFTAAAHAADIKIIIDLVLNHTSIEHKWFKDAVRSVSSQKRNYYLWSKTGKEFKNAVNSFHHFKPQNWILSPKTNEYYFTTFYPEQADLNWDNKEIHNEFFKIMDFWASNGADGFRLDAASHLIKREGSTSQHLPQTHAILKMLRKRLIKTHSNAVLIAEVGGRIETAKSYFGKGDECHLVYNFQLAAEMIYALVFGAKDRLNKALRLSGSLPGISSWIAFLRNHDELNLDALNKKERIELIKKVDPAGIYRFKGDAGLSMRLANIFSGNTEKILEAFKLLFHSPGSSVIYYGDEIGMKNLDIENLRDTRKLVRGAFDWSEANRQMKDPDSLLCRIAHLIKNV